MPGSSMLLVSELVPMLLLLLDMLLLQLPNLLKTPCDTSDC